MNYSTGKGGDYCSTAFLTAGPDQTYSYIACQGGPGNEHCFVGPTTTIQSTTISSSSIQATTLTTLSATTSSPLSTSSLPSSTPTLTTQSWSFPSTVAQAGASTLSTSNSNSNNLGVIIGGVVGGLAIICFFALGVIYLLRRRQHSGRTPNPDNTPPKVPPNGSESSGGVAFPLEKQGEELSTLYPKWKTYTSFEMPTGTTNGPSELAS
jgi:hypothetical protein